MYHPAHAKHIFDEDTNAADLHDPDLVVQLPPRRPARVRPAPGETVYIPRGWPHYAGLDATVSLTVNSPAPTDAPWTASACVNDARVRIHTRAERRARG